MLRYRTDFELLIAVILSARTTDALVNRVTPALFAKYPDAEGLAHAAVSEVEQIVKPTGFYRMKAKNIVACANKLAGDHGGRLPATMEELVALPGVGRKTAGVILAVIHRKNAIIVDTHFGRVARRLGLTSQTEASKVEREIARRVDEHLWSSLSMLLNRHGRRYCTARSPKCCECPIAELCPSYACRSPDGFGNH